MAEHSPNRQTAGMANWMRKKIEAQETQHKQAALFQEHWNAFRLTSYPGQIHTAHKLKIPAFVLHAPPPKQQLSKLETFPLEIIIQIFESIGHRHVSRTSNFGRTALALTSKHMLAASCSVKSGIQVSHAMIESFGDVNDKRWCRGCHRYRHRAQQYWDNLVWPVTEKKGLTKEDREKLRTYRWSIDQWVLGVPHSELGVEVLPWCPVCTVRWDAWKGSRRALLRNGSRAVT